MELPNEENFTEEMEKQVIEVKNKCNFFPPQFIIDEYQVKHNKALSGEKRKKEINIENYLIIV